MSRSLSTIARDIARDWTKPAYCAAPYLDAMKRLDSMSDRYGCDTATSVVAYFLGNASTWRGPVAKAIKAELNAMVKGARS